MRFQSYCVGGSFISFASGAKQGIKDAGLLSKVTSSLSETVVEIVILNNEVKAERAKEPAKNGVTQIRTNTRVAKQLNIIDIETGNIPMEEWNRPHCVGQKWNDHDIKRFLNVICKRCHQGSGVLGGMMSSVDSPEPWNLVKSSMVDVEEEIYCHHI